MCGAPISQEAFLPKPEKKPSKLPVILGGIAVIVVIIIVAAVNSGSDSPPTVAPVPVVTETAPPYTALPPGDDDYPEENLGAPHEHITDSGLRQALELLFGRELHSVDWDAIGGIRAMMIERDGVVFGFVGEDAAASAGVIASGADIDSDNGVAGGSNTGNIINLDTIASLGTWVRPDAEVSDFTQLRYFKNLEVLSLGFGQVNQEILLGVSNVQELEVPAGRTIADLTPFVALPGLTRLYVSGRNFNSLQGISELANLYSLGLTSTGITDLSVLNQQRNITELILTDNRELPSFNTLQEMYWLRGLHITRSTERDLHFISHLTNLEALSLVRTDTRTLNFILPLTNLLYLRLFDNRDVPEIPNLAVFTQLEELYLDVGGTTGTVRPSTYLEGLTSVRRMTLRNPDTLDGLRGMQYLEELDISFGWLLTDAAPLGALTNLRRLRIYESRTFHSEVSNMDAIGRLTNLRQLNISGNDLYFNWDFIYRMENLEELNISRNNVIGNFSGISGLQNLRVLRMDRIRIMTSYRISRDGGMVGISFVGSSDMQDHAAAIAQLTQLEILSVSGNDLRDISFVENMSNLRVFLAENNFVEEVSPLAELSALTVVDLRRNAVGNWSVLDELINTTIHGR